MYLRTRGEYEPLDPPRRTVELRVPSPRPPAPPPAESAVTSAYASCARNGRVRTPLGSQQGWTLQWRVPIPGTYAGTILATEERIVVIGHLWRLFTSGGEEVANEHAGWAPTIASDARLLQVESSGALCAYDLARGRREFYMIPSRGYSSMFLFIASHGTRLLLASTTGDRRDAHDHEVGDPHSCLEAFDLGDPMELDGTLDVLSLQEQGSLSFHEDGLRAAPAPDGLGARLALRDRLVVVGADLRPTAVLTGSFEPVQLSVDDEGWFHVVVALEGERALWIVAPDGGCARSESLPFDLAAPSGPPAIGLDRRVILVGEQRVTCYGQDGRTLWSRVPQGKSVGWLVTGDDRFVLAELRRVAVMDGLQEVTLFHAPAGEKIMAGPCLTPRGALLVATERELLCYERR